MHIIGKSKTLDEFQEELNALSIEGTRGYLLLNSANSVSPEVISIAVGAGIALLSQAIVAYLNKNKGQRKMVIQLLDDNKMLQRVEVESPRLEEIDKLLKKAMDVFIVEEDKKQMTEPPAAPRTRSPERRDEP